MGWRGLGKFLCARKRMGSIGEGLRCSSVLLMGAWNAERLSRGMIRVFMNFAIASGGRHHQRLPTHLSV